MKEELEQRIKEQEAILEERYSAQIHELADRLGEMVALTEAKIDYMVRTGMGNKYSLLHIILTYHRTKL